MSQSNFSYDTNTDKKITAITSAYILSATVDVNHLTLDGITVDGITWDPRDNDIRKLVTAKALNDTLIDLNKKLDAIDPHHNLYQDNTVLTLPVVDSSFSQHSWEYSNWEVVQGDHATYTGGTGDNYLKIKNYPFTRTGEYFISIDISVLDSGKLIIYNENNEKVAEAIVPGKFNTFYTPQSPATATLKLVAENVFNKEAIIINGVNIYYVTNRIRRYLEYMVPFITSGGGGYASIDYVDKIREQLQSYLDDQLSKIPNLTDIANFSNHIKDRVTNPHGITTEMIHAAKDDHTHLPVDINAADRYHTHIPSDIGAADANHTHTPESIGAAAVDHTHLPEDIGAAPTIHHHDEYISKDTAKEEITSLVNEVVGESTATTRPLMSRYGGEYIKQNVGYFPELNIPKTVLWPNRIIHRYKNPLDPISGYSYANKPRVNNTGSFDAFFTDLRGSTRSFAQFDTTPTEDDPTIIGYRLHTMRDTIHYTLRYDDREEITHRPVSWKVKYRNRIIDEQTNVEWEDGVTHLTVDFEEPISIRDIIFEITDLAPLSPESDDEGEITEYSPLWGVHFEVVLSTAITTLDSETGDPITTGEGALLSVVENGNIFTYSDVNGGAKSLTVPTGNIDTDTMGLTDFIHVYCTKHLDMDETVYSLESTSCPPEYGYKRNGIPLFADYVPDSITHSGKYGTLTIPNVEDDSTLLDNESNLSYLYTYPRAYDFTLTEYTFVPKEIKRILTTEGTTSITIEHTNIPYLNLLGWTLYTLPSDVKNRYCPNHITVRYTRSTTNYPTFEDEVPTLPTEDEYGKQIIEASIDEETKVLTYTAILIDTVIVPRYVDDDEDWAFYDSLNGEINTVPITDITGISYTFENTTGGDRVGILGIQPLFTEDFYDINKNILYDRNNEAITDKVYIGSARVFTDRDNKTLLYPFITPIGTECIIPLDIITVSDAPTITIANPFYTKHVTILPGENILNTIYETNGAAYSPAIRVKDITPERITMVVEKGLRSVVVRRLW